MSVLSSSLVYDKDKSYTILHRTLVIEWSENNQRPSWWFLGSVFDVRGTQQRKYPPKLNDYHANVLFHFLDKDRYEFPEMLEGVPLSR